ncbi:MAG: glycoside hydrolase family 3 protein [Actinobacteria bacterium]|nr:glycoside hydrolase family 3 protein [Actinomycetota bacterium]MCA1720989.1 glycoside hydrolase family 3 protein [Actinomycetota bacterium]
MQHRRRRKPQAGLTLLLAGLVALPVGLLAASPGPVRRAVASARHDAPTSPLTAASPTAASCTPAPLEQRAGAVIMVGLPGVTRADDPLAKKVLSLGVSGIFLAAGNVQSPAQVRDLTTGLRAAAGRPLLVSTDEESGRVAATRAVVGEGPSPRRLARQRTPEQVRDLAAEIGRDLHHVGINLDFAPLVDLDDGPSGQVIGDRSFSKDPATTERYAGAFAEGLAAGGVTPTIKHFPGHGRSAADSHLGSSKVTATLDDLRLTDLAPFQQLIERGAPIVMMNHLDYSALDPELPASLSPAAYSLLRSMGFRGVAVTDSLGMGAVNLRWDFPEAAVRAIEAGADSAFATDGNQAARMRAAIVTAVRSGRISEQRLNEAAARLTALAGGDPMTLTCTSATALRFPTG